MQIPKELTTVTTLSKSVALIMFISLPIIAFLFGMKYQTMVVNQNSPVPTVTIPTSVPIGCTMDVQICPDGTAVGRVAPDCEFKKCPNSTKVDFFCGGIAGKLCPTGFYCKYEGNNPDAGGSCIKTSEENSQQTIYACPEDGWINCMPMLSEEGKKYCSREAIQWYETNCPSFKGVAY